MYNNVKILNWISLFKKTAFTEQNHSFPLQKKAIKLIEKIYEKVEKLKFFFFVEYFYSIVI